jgi:hypothetical protein
VVYAKDVARAGRVAAAIEAGQVYGCWYNKGWGGVTPSAGSIPKFVARKANSVKIRSKCTEDSESCSRIDQIDEFQWHVADHWRGG